MGLVSSSLGHAVSGSKTATARNEQMGVNRVVVNGKKDTMLRVSEENWLIDIVSELFKIYSKQFYPQATWREKFKNTPWQIELQKHQSIVASFTPQMQHKMLRWIS